jgi:hypothetical protein
MTDRRWLEEWADAVAVDPENAHIGRFSDFAVRLLDTDGGDVVVHYDHGTVRWDDGATPLVTLRAARRTWRELVSSDAPPRRHDLLSLVKADGGIEVVEGWEHVVRHLRVVTRLVELGRTVGTR